MIDFITPPWEHQRKAVEFSNHTEDLALFFEMGTGKTKTTIDILRQRFVENKRLMRTLVIGPVIVVKNWEKEFGMHSRIPSREIVPLLGPGKKRVRTFTEATLDPATLTNTRSKIIITNYEAMQMEDLVKLIMEWRPEVLVCDESQRLKDVNGRRSKVVQKIARLCTHRYILTGTPILNSAMDIFGQYLVLDAGKTFGDNFYTFRAMFFEDMNDQWKGKQAYFPKYEPRIDTYQQLNDMIYRKAMRVLKKDCLDLPPLVRERRYVELGVEQKRMYEEMKNEYVTWVKAHEASGEPRAVVAQMALTKALRLAQIASGYAKTEDGAEVKIKDNPRMVALKELLEEISPNHKVIVWATFHENYRQIAAVCKELGIDYVELHGGVSHTEKSKAMHRFQNDKACRVIIANQQAAGIGCNLVEDSRIVGRGQCSYSIFYSRNFSLEQDLQAESRNYRGGSEVYESVTRIDLVAQGTIDELILEALANKQKIAEKVLAWKEEL